MKIFRRKKTEETPTIIFNPESRIFLFVATSWPENAKLFYDPVIEWLETFFSTDTSDKKISIRFKFTYFNTSSAKQIAKILTLLKKYYSTKNIEIQWFHDADDFDMKREGMRFGKILGLNMSFIEK